MTKDAEAGVPPRQFEGEEPIRSWVGPCRPDESRADYIARVVDNAGLPSPEQFAHLARLLGPLGVRGDGDPVGRLVPPRKPVTPPKPNKDVLRRRLERMESDAERLREELAALDEA